MFRTVNHEAASDQPAMGDRSIRPVFEIIRPVFDRRIKMHVPYAMCIDFESLIERYKMQDVNSTETKSKHKACGFGYVVVR